MSWLLPALGIASVILLVVSGPSYFWGTIKGQIKPQRATWFIWSVLGVTAFTSQLALGARWSLLFTAVEGGGNVVMFLLSLRYGVGGWSKLDRFALAVAAVGIVISLVSRQPIVALIGVIIADVSGIILTAQKVYRDPASESAAVWLMVGTSALLAAAAVGRFNFGLWLYPVYFALGNYSIVVAQQLGRQRHRHAAR